MVDPDAWATTLAGAALASRTPGVVLGVWHEGVETVLPYGVLSTRTGVTTTSNSVFQIGSITKTWTSTMICQLVEEGRLRLEDTVADLLPGVRLGSPDLADRISVEQLLTHTSGLDGDVFTDTGRGDDCLQRYVDLLVDVVQVYAPGSAYSYCNTGFVLLGRIIEVLDGVTWDESLRARLVDPLDLTDVCTLPEEALLRRAAVGHQDGEPVTQWCLSRALGPAGLITTTAHDLLTYARQWLGGDVPEALTSWTQPRYPVPPSWDVDAVSLTWRLTEWDGHRVLGHSGGTIGQSAQLFVVPDLALAVCVLTNAGSIGAILQDVLPGVVHDLTGVVVAAPPAPDPAATPTGLSRHAGVYERREYRIEVSGTDDALSALLVPIGELSGHQEAERVALVASDATGDRFVARSAPTDPWAPFVFSTLPDGTPQLFFASRAAPLQGTR